MTSKLVDNKRRNHADKILQKMSKKASEPTPKQETVSSATPSVSSLREQYEVIRDDILKLREDLTKGYDLAKGMIEKKGLINQFLKAR